MSQFQRDMGWGFIGLPVDNLDINEYDTVTMRQFGEVRMPVRKIIEMIKRNKESGFPDVLLPISSDGNVGPLPFYKLPHPVGLFQKS